MNEIKTINSFEQLEKILQETSAVLVYFSTNSCNVGEALEPKVYELLNTDFPKIAFYKVDMNFSPEIAAKYSAFVEPTILVFFEGKETIRKSRNIGIYELQSAILRPYKLIFE
ncbi:MAG TPA: thioredoxin family protein [Lutibacter sp.]|nr:thioredoxin family protein [Lutibacter sp.]